MNVAASVGIVEARRLMLNPALWVSLAPAVLWAAFVGDDPLGEHFLLSGFGLALCWFVVMAAVALAARRTGASNADELFDLLPCDPSRRTFAIGVGGAAVALVALAVTMAVWVWRSPGTFLGMTTNTVPSMIMIPRPNAAQFLQGPLVLLVFVGVGLLIGRWAPTSLVVPVLLVPILVQFVLFGVWEAGGTTWYSWLLPMARGWVSGDRFGECGSNNGDCVLPLVGFDEVTPWWHMGYLVCCAGFLFAVASLPGHGGLRRWMAAGCWLGAVVAFGIVQLVVYERFPGVAV